jgi:hypothetical protein
MQAKNERFSYLIYSASFDEFNLAITQEPNLILEKSENGKTLFEWLANTITSQFPEAQKFSALIKQAVASGILFDKAEHDGRTLLHIAIDANNEKPQPGIFIPDQVTIILEQIPNLNLNTLCPSGRTALSYAIKNYNIGAAKTLIKAGADLTFRGNFNSSPIATAVKGILELESNPNLVQYPNSKFARRIQWEGCIVEMKEIYKQLLAHEKSIAEIRKNARVLSLAHEEDSCTFFEKIGPETLIEIAGFTGDPMIHTKKQAKNIAYQFFGRPALIDDEKLIDKMTIEEDDEIERSYKMLQSYSKNL